MLFNITTSIISFDDIAYLYVSFALKLHTHVYYEYTSIILFKQPRIIDDTIEIIFN